MFNLSILLIATALFGVTLAQQQQYQNIQTINTQPGQNQTISLNPTDGNNLQLRIVFQQPSSIEQASPCATGNCQPVATSVAASPCATGNCQNIVVGNNNMAQASPCATGNCQPVAAPVAASPCATGNCQNIVVGNNNIAQASPCSTGNCQNIAYDTVSTVATTTAAPSTYKPLIQLIQPRINTNNNVKVIRLPAYSPPCGQSGCGQQYPRFFYSPRRFYAPRPIFRMSGNRGSSSNVAIPDTIYRNGQAIRAPIRIPSSYQDGNPVFNSGK